MKVGGVNPGTGGAAPWSAFRHRRKGRGWRALHSSVLAVVMLGGLWGCDDTTTVVPAPGFAGDGELRADVEIPLAGGLGRVEGTLVWQSDGRWVLVERIYLGTQAGPLVERRSRGNPGDLVQEYASLVNQLNEAPGLRLPGEVSQGGPTVCSDGRSRVRFTMADRFRSEVASWSRCASGNLFNLTPGSAGPDAGAVRVVTAIQLVRAFTVGDAERSVFEGSLPFATLDEGEVAPGRDAEPQAFYSLDGTEPAEWRTFWSRHAPGGGDPPPVDWNTQMVLFVTGGPRFEAGHRVRVRRVLPVGAATQIQSVEEIPGDFCAPAALEQHPYHLVVAPRGPIPVTFADLLPLRIPCGGVGGP